MSSFAAATLIFALSAPSGFDALKSKAEPLEKIQVAVTALVGICDQEDPVMQIQCQENVSKQRKELQGRRFYLDLGAGHQDLLEFEGVHGSKARFLWVPMYDPGHGMPLTMQKPKKLTAEGWPILPKKVLDAAMPKGVLSTDLKRLSRLGQINIEIIGSFGTVWQLNSRGKAVRGVMFKLEALRFSQARTGETVIEVVY